MTTMTDLHRDPQHQDASVQARRRAAVRTALWLGAIAFGIFVAFLLSGVLGQ